MELSSEDEEVIAFVKSLPPITRELFDEARAIKPRIIDRQDPLAQVIAQSWQEPMPDGMRRLGRGSGGRCVAVRRSLLYPDDSNSDSTEEHVLKMTVSVGEYAYEEMMDEARAYKRMTALQGICIPTLLEFVEFEISETEYSQLPEKVRSEGQVHQFFCYGCKDSSSRRICLDRKEQSDEQSLTSFRCSQCRKDLELGTSPIKLCTLVLKETGTVLPELLEAAYNLDQIAYDVQSIIGCQLQRQYLILKLYASASMFFEENPLAERNVIALVNSKELASSKTVEDFSAIKIFLIDFGKWDHDYCEFPHAKPDYEAYLQSLIDERAEYVKLICRKNEDRSENWDDYLAIRNSLFRRKG